MGQGFFGYNPPDFILDAAKQALDRVECNQYSPTRGRPRLRQALSDAYSPLWGRKLDPETEITVTTGANEGESASPSRFQSHPWVGELTGHLPTYLPTQACSAPLWLLSSPATR